MTALRGRVCEALVRAVDRLAEAVAATLVVATAIITCLAVFFRYVLNSALGWPEEIGGYLLVWISFVGAYLATRSNAHVSFDLLVSKLPIALRRVTALCVDLILVAYFAILLATSVRLIRTVGGTSIETLEIPYGVFMAVLPVSSFLLVIALLANVARRLGGDWR